MCFHEVRHMYTHHFHYHNFNQTYLLVRRGISYSLSTPLYTSMYVILLNSHFHYQFAIYLLVIMQMYFNLGKPNKYRFNHGVMLLH